MPEYPTGYRPHINLHDDLLIIDDPHAPDELTYKYVKGRGWVAGYWEEPITITLTGGHDTGYTGPLMAATINGAIYTVNWDTINNTWTLTV